MQTRLFYVGIGVAVALLAALDYPIFLNQIYVGTDLADFHIPARQFYQTCMEVGDRFNWWPNEFNGFYLTGEGQASQYHPLNLISYRFLPLEFAFNLEFLRSYVLLLGGMFFFIRCLGVARDGAILGALLFTFSSFNLLHYMHVNVVAAVAHTPWLLLAIHVAMTTSSTRRLALAIGAVFVLTASQLLLAHLQFVWISLLLEGSYGLLLYVRSRGHGRATRVVAAKLLGATAAAIQLIPVWETFWDSSRAAADSDFLTAISLMPFDVARLFAPYLPNVWSKTHRINEISLYSGALIPVLIAWLGIRWRALGSDRLPALVSLIVAAVALWLAFGAAAGLYQLQMMIPVAGLFRAPSRYIVVFQLALAVASAIAFVDLRSVSASGIRWPWRKSWALWIPVAASGVIAVLFAEDFRGRDGSLAILDLASGPLVFLVATSLAVAATRGARGALVALLLFTALDLGSYGFRYVWKDEPSNVETLTKKFAPKPGSEKERVLSEHRLSWGKGATMLSGTRLAWGYVAMFPNRHLINLSLLRRDEVTQDTALRVCSVGWGLRGPHPHPLARARLVTHAVRSDSPIDLLAETDVETTALVDRSVPPLGGTTGRAEIVRDRPGDITIRTTAPGRQILVVSESHHVGWKAEVDGTPAEILRAYGELMGVVVEPGEHSVQLYFDPESLRIGKWVSAFSLLIAVCWLGAEWLRERIRPGC